tara:strand:- start:1306 stop:1593 length:288 start_codon:yes stop_codon:yes gene_type:complete
MIRITIITVPATGFVPATVRGMTWFDQSLLPSMIMSVIDPSGLDNSQYITLNATMTTPIDFGAGCQVFFRTFGGAPAANIGIMTDIQAGDPVGVV